MRPLKKPCSWKDGLPVLGSVYSDDNATPWSAGSWPSVDDPPWSIT
jgi:hypothetical protein